MRTWGDPNTRHIVRFHLIAPLLRELIIKDSSRTDYRHFLFPEGSPPNTSYLETLVIEASDDAPTVPVYVRQFHQDLCQMPVLTELSLRGISCRIEEDNPPSPPARYRGLVAAFKPTNDGTAGPVPRLETLALGFESPPEGLDQAVLELVRSRGGTGPGRAVKLRSLKVVDAGMTAETYDSLKADLPKFRNQAFEMNRLESVQGDNDDDEGNSLGYATDDDLMEELDEQWEGDENDSDW